LDAFYGVPGIVTRWEGTPVPNFRTVLVIFVVLAVVVAGWLFGAVFVSRYLLH